MKQQKTCTNHLNTLQYPRNRTKVDGIKTDARYAGHASSGCISSSGALGEPRICHARFHLQKNEKNDNDINYQLSMSFIYQHL